MVFKHVFAVAATLLPLAAVAIPASQAPAHHKRTCPSNAESYCPSVCDPDTATLESLFKAFNAEFFSGDIAGAFAKYVSPSIIEHTSSSTSYSEDVSSLTPLVATVDFAIIAGLELCTNDICFVHYKVTPKPGSQFLDNVTSAVDIYRYDGSCIVEHWDAVQTADETTTNPQFPGQ